MIFVGVSILISDFFFILYYILIFLEEYNNSYNVVDSPFRKLMDLFDEHEGKIGEILLDYKTVDKRVFKMFLDIAMPAVSKTNFIQCISIEGTFHDIVTTGEETFAILVLENYCNRWRHIACGERGLPPSTKYQKQIKERTNDQSTTGSWTQDGIIRFNEIAVIVRRVRTEEGRIGFCKNIKDIYNEESDNNVKIVNKRRRIMEENERRKRQNRRVAAVDLFDEGTIDLM